ncbi:hypothetical protein [uncultured Roseovarius sp.]|uniref:hypothetical protein n=1 Tax=uncultured Roseovarius sp. TaxID=293344 RepID=UPI0025CF33B5|nr:hypothetical protein [uncultured Roseovarius sp.]
MRLRGIRRNRNIDDRHPMGRDGKAVIGGVGLPRVRAIGFETGEMGRSDTHSVIRP